MQSCWFGDVDAGQCAPFTGDAAACARRVREIRASMDSFVPLDWQQAVSCGVCRDRAEYLAMLQKVCIAGSEQAVREQYAAKDVELLQMVRTLDEMDTVINVLSERVADWYQIRHPSSSRKYRRTPAHVLVKSISERNGNAAGVGERSGKLRRRSPALPMPGLSRKRGLGPGLRSDAEHERAYRRARCRPAPLPCRGA